MPKVKQYNTKSFYFPERITKTLNEILAYPFTIVEAPMGYGKTTAVRAYLNKAGVNMLWQRVYDSSTLSFWNSFSRLFRELDDNRSQSLVQLGFPANSVSAQEALNLIEDIKFPVKTVLVIEDYHVIDSPEVNKFIELLVEYEIDNLHIVLTARYTKIQKLEELAIKGYLNYITKETFELSQKEIIEYYNLCGICLNNFEADKLYAATEGWISALYLFMLEYIAEGHYTPEKNIYKLIEKAIYAQFSDEIKDFVVALCIFDNFTYDQAFYMWGKYNTGELIDELISRNNFVKYDGRTKVYQMHNIFISFLKEVLEGKEINYKQQLYRKAAHWFMGNGNCMAARRYFYECKDFDGILNALEVDVSNDYSSLNKELLKKYMAECPTEIRFKHHYALLIYAMHLFVHKEFKMFHQICHELNVNIEKDNALDTDTRNKFLGELELLLSFAEFNDIKKMSERHKKAWELLNQPTTVYDTGTNWTFGSPSVLSLYYRDSGSLEAHISDLKEAMPYYYRLTNGHGSGAEYAMEAESLFNQGDFKGAEISAQKALLKAQSGMDENIVLSAEYLQILISFMKGDVSKVMNLMNKMHEEMIIKNDYHFINTIEICEGCIYAYLDQIDKIPRRLLDHDMSNPRLRFPAFSFFNVMYGRMLLIKGEYLKLIGSADHFISIASILPNLLGYVYTYIYLAAAYRKIYRENEALLNLKKALEIAMPDKQYMLFVENCDYIEELLVKISLEGSYREAVEKILKLYKTFKNSKEQMISTYFAKEKPKLTKREIEIARLASSGITTSEIGKQLYISGNTVKAALRSIYTKLSINNRTLLQQYMNKNYPMGSNMS